MVKFIDKKTNKELEFENTYENRGKNNLTGVICNFDSEEKAGAFLTWLINMNAKAYALFLNGEYYCSHGQQYITVF